MSKTIKTLLVLGDDKIGRAVAWDLPELDNVKVVMDASSSPKRVLKLLWKRRLRLDDFVKMAWAEVMRPAVARPEGFDVIANNSKLVGLIETYKPERMVLLRGGLIINKKVLATGIDAQNIHCARLPDYGGLATIPRALRDGALNQKATLHRITTRIDEGDVLDEEPYDLNPKVGYGENEKVAYAAGKRLLWRTLGL